MNYKKFLLFGDSITEFAYDPEHYTVGSALSNAYTRKLDVIQRGYAGYTSRWAIPVLEKIIAKDGEDVIMGTIFFGANDAVLAGPQVVPIDEYVQNVKKMINMMKNADIKPIVVGPGLINRDVWDVVKKEDVDQGWIRTNEAFKKYNDALIELTKVENVPYIDIGQAFLDHAKQVGENWKDYTIDGLHFSGKGYRVYFNELMDKINTCYPEFSPENVKTNLTNWREVKEDGSNIF